MTFLDYVLSGEGEFERFDFENPDDAYNFGWALREQIEREGDSDCISVEMSNNVVRVRLLNPVTV